MVEHLLAKERVESSNLFIRFSSNSIFSNFFSYIIYTAYLLAIFCLLLGFILKLVPFFYIFIPSLLSSAFSVSFFFLYDLACNYALFSLLSAPSSLLNNHVVYCVIPFSDSSDFLSFSFLILI